MRKLFIVCVVVALPLDVGLLAPLLPRTIALGRCGVRLVLAVRQAILALVLPPNGIRHSNRGNVSHIRICVGSLKIVPYLCGVPLRRDEIKFIYN